MDDQLKRLLEFVLPRGEIQFSLSFHGKTLYSFPCSSQARSTALAISFFFKFKNPMLSQGPEQGDFYQLTARMVRGMEYRPIPLAYYF